MSTLDPSATTPAPRPRRSASGRWLAGLGLFLAVLAVLGVAAWQGYQAGQAQRTAGGQATLAADLQVQYDLAVANLADGNYTLASARLEYILKVDPNYRDAAQRLAEARAALKVTVTAPPPATPTLAPASSNPEAWLALADQAYASENWDLVLRYLAALNALDRDYEAVKVDGMLRDALRNRGVARIQGDEMELGITDLDQSEQFSPLDEEAASYRRWAKSYLAAQSYWGVNWEQAVLILDELYLMAPYFKDTATRLFQADQAYAAQLAAAGDVCGAADRYAAAQRLFVDDGAAAAQATAQVACALTPTPAATDAGAATPTPTPTPAP